MKCSLFLLVILIFAAPVFSQEDTAPIVYSIGGNAWVGSENDDDKGTPAEGLVSSSSYHFQLSYKFPTKKEKSSWVPFAKSTQQYVSGRILKFRSNTGDQDGYEWVESLEAIGFVYGQRYFLKENYQGFNVGWYLGMMSATATGYEWVAVDPNPSVSAYEEKFIAPLWAIEIDYHFEIGPVYIEPTYSFYVNTQAKTFEGFPTIIVGLQFSGN